MGWFGPFGVNSERTNDVRNPKASVYLVHFWLLKSHHLKMQDHAMCNSRFGIRICSAVSVCALLLGASLVYGGTERITLVCGGFIPNGGSNDTVPVYVTLANGQPDYIDMTYYATDSTGAIVSCSPPTNRFYLTKKQSATDTVVVASSVNLPVTFSAFAQGEAAGGDSEGATESLTGFTVPPRVDRGPVTASLAGPLTLGTPAQLNRYVFPVTASLINNGTNPVTLLYSAVDSSAHPVSLRCRPKAQETFTIAKNDATTNGSSTRMVLVYVDGATPPVKFTVANQAGGTPVTYIINGATNSPQNNGTVQLAVASPIQLPEVTVPVTLEVQPDSPAKLYYSAFYGPANNPTAWLDCIPSTSKQSANVKVDTSLVPTGNNTQVTFMAIAIDEDHLVSQANTTFNVP
jgi:hypothetical protein